ncbi:MULTISPECIES: substrate-binding domain-containing protein [unclassified Oceanobacter]|jgi:phosphate transport system substrate-binding protein|uniref:substrate-binding domain-containing protein n=1 Tax=unclassified Oceanobacter TaxID=2620260 RepID=UPI0026E32700|nr:MULTISPECIES: substrate-binding domain-containing protein [unclassified Oceanobacter]MDO6683418.1 substrate-binding domain-containing protein [Oceanobacter sp. 5_MG-2023]MDP2506894.1 substrate-binding domain-containing protein [Oceanobacter sp. 3_MG-2023]MDP2547779.1 substrate-binding domain-containing protein [Oceanobacter sp. 4_MG-2023]MDP2608445.1 substrate-binding domain-containing protein [Oceanobacter sp. 1_MG-2023]MDP2611540.1 substrate-binding domain-containing protein [Oceanobacter
MKHSLAAGVVLLASVFSQSAFAERNYISIVGSSTVYPFSTVVAERFGKSSKFRTPKVESTGSGGGLKLFCSGVGDTTPDITNSSRRIKASEVALCAKNGVKEIVEVTIGFDGIVFANAAEHAQASFSTKEIFLALAKMVPAANGSEKLIANPYKTWQQINPALDNTPIKVLGPPPTSGTRDAFVELAMEGGCSAFPFIKALKKSDPDKYKAICHGLREDGGYVEAGENDNLIVQKLAASPDSYGIFGYSFLEQNEDKVQGSLIDGIEPTFDNISSSEYPVSRSLHFYVKKAHVGVIPGIEEFLAEFTSSRAIGEDGYLADKGMIPMDESRRRAMAADVKALTLLGQ